MQDDLREFTSTLQAYGYKLTNQRRAVLLVIEKNKDLHLSAEEIFDRVRSQNPHIGLATVYRTIQVLEKVGLVHRLLLNDGCVRYQLADPDKHSKHHHLICNVCGSVTDVHLDMLDIFGEDIFKQKGFEVTSCNVQFFGICESCKNK